MSCLHVDRLSGESVLRARGRRALLALHQLDPFSVNRGKMPCSLEPPDDGWCLSQGDEVPPGAAWSENLPAWL